MRILVINPNTTQAMTDEIAVAARSVADKSTVIECVSPPAGPPSIEGYADEVMASYHLIEMVANTRGQYDAYVIACFGDPGLEACREISDVPVIGIAEAAFHMASLVAGKWSIVSILPRIKPLLQGLVDKNAMTLKCASIRCTPLSVLEIEADIERTKQIMLAEARSAIELDGAEAILLGCAGLGPIDKFMQQELGVPVIDGTACAVLMAQSLFVYGLTTAKVSSYLAPEPKALKDCPPSLTALYQRARDLA